MKILNKMKFIALLSLIVLMQFIFIPAPNAYAATTPDLGQAASFGIFSGTYTNTVGGTTITGDLGYTTGPAVAPTVNGTTYTPPSTKYSTAGTDENAALANLNGQACTFTFANGAIDLATDTTHGPLGVYTPGVYCTGAASAASIGAAGITLSGSGTYIFKINGAFTTVANSVVTLSGGASNCDVFWAPTAATTLGATSTFAGTDIDASGITIGSTVRWTGRALAFGGTVSTDTDTITAPTCAVPTSGSGSSSSGSSSNSSPSTGGTPPCIASPITTIPVIIESKRISPTSIFISWGPFAGINKFTVRYGLANENWAYNTNVTGFSTTLNALPANRPIWVEVAAANNCSIGTYSQSQLVGGPSLPGTGFAPPEDTTPWYTPEGILSYLILSFLLKFIHG